MKLLLLLLCGIGLWCAGCRSASELDRKTPPRRRHVPAHRVEKKRMPGKKESVDPAFDMMFRRKQEHKGASVLSDREKEMMRRSAGEDASALHSVRDGRIRENTRQKDGVFGTENGKYLPQGGGNGKGF